MAPTPPSDTLYLAANRVNQHFNALVHGNLASVPDTPQVRVLTTGHEGLTWQRPLLPAPWSGGVLSLAASFVALFDCLPCVAIRLRDGSDVEPSASSFENQIPKEGRS